MGSLGPEIEREAGVAHDGPLPKSRMPRMLERAARAREPWVAASLQRYSLALQVHEVRFGGYARKGAYYDYGRRRAFVSRQVLAFGSQRLVEFILAHEVGHASQVAAKRNAAVFELVGTLGLACWVLSLYGETASAAGGSPGLFFGLLGAFAGLIRFTDLWWEIDADRKARTLTGFRGSLRGLFEEFLSVEVTRRMTWQARVRTWVGDLLGPRARVGRSA